MADSTFTSYVSRTNGVGNEIRTTQGICFYRAEISFVLSNAGKTYVRLEYPSRLTIHSILESEKARVANLLNWRNDGLYNKKEAADYLTVSERTVDRERAKGTLKWIQIGGRVRFNIADLDEYIKKHTLGGSPMSG